MIDMVPKAIMLNLVQYVFTATHTSDWSEELLFC